MKNPLELFQEMQEKAQSFMKDGPAKEFQSHFQAWMNDNWQRLNLVTREEFDRQAAILQRTQEKLELLEKTLDDLTKQSTQAVQNTQNVQNVQQTQQLDEHIADNAQAH